jgi:multidrug resistance efflux pump
MGRSRKPWIIAVIVPLLAAGAGGTWWKYGRPAPDTGQIVLLGTTDIREAHLAFRVADRVAEVFVDEGDAVTKGQLLAALDTSVLEADHAAAKASADASEQVLARLRNGSRPEEIARGKALLAAAEARLKDSASTLTDVLSMRDKGAANAREVVTAQAANDEDAATVESLKATLALLIAGPRVEDIAAAAAEHQAALARVTITARHLADAQLVAPEAGIIRARLHELGEMVGPASPVLLLAITDPVWVRVYLDETDLGKVALGMRASVRIDADPGTTYEGWLGSISPTAEFTPKPVETERLRTSLVYQARVFVKDPGQVFKLGMPATVTLQVGDDIVGSQAGAAPAGQ